MSATCLTAPFGLKRAAPLAALVSMAFAGQAIAAAGRIDFVIGNAEVRSANGVTRPIARGMELDSGDVIRTTEGRAQVRFTDGAFISLQPNTEFAIRDYRFEGQADGSERGFFSLTRGAMRLVTGLVGRVNRNNYQISTPTATVGIRGTGGLIQILVDGSTLVLGSTGIWTLTNNSATVEVPAGTSAVAGTNQNNPPQQSNQAPSTNTTPPDSGYNQGNNVTADGKAADVPLSPLFTPLVSGTGFAGVAAFGHDGGEGGMYSNVDHLRSTMIFNTAGQLTAASGTALPGVGGGMTATLQPGGSHAEFQTDGILAWGRWIGPVQYTSAHCECGPTTANYGPNTGLHYVVGMPTPVMPTSGTATYSLHGATSPTYIDGSTGPGSFSGAINVTFGPTTAVGMNFNIAMPNGAGYNMTGTANTTSALFTQSMTVNPTAGGACAVEGCGGYVRGFFSGTAAQRIGVGYEIYEYQPGPTRYLTGAAAFKKN